VARCFYLAFAKIAEQRGMKTPPWGMLTGVRPDKPVTWALAAGKTPEQAQAMLEETYFVSPARAELAVETGSAALRAASGWKLPRLSSRASCSDALRAPFAP
jgi:oxygen-independent coproporphyrinogen-3 oxidase